jgi:serine/threonine protein kinase
MGYKKGEILNTAFDEYTVVRPIGNGASGEVYEVRDTDGNPFAAKILDPKKASTDRLKRFRNEIGFCSMNEHPNIVRVLASGVTEKKASFYVMRLYSGTLRNALARGIEATEVLPLFGKVLDGVEAAHMRGVWHRDLKPENILYSQDNGDLAVADFGIAHFEEEDLLTAVETAANDRLANYLYSAPEQKARGKQVNEKADVFALGLILNEMFTGSVPLGVGFPRISARAPAFAYLDDLVEEMRHQDPSNRPSIAKIKQQLIARGNEFISAQKLSALKATVIPDHEVDDPAVTNPLRIASVDYVSGYLQFSLNAPPPPNWIMAFRNPRGSFSFYGGVEPVTFDFDGPRMRVRLPIGARAAQIAEYAKSYVEMANEQYRSEVFRRNQARILEERQALQRRVAEEERRREVLAEVREIKI